MTKTMCYSSVVLRTVKEYPTENQDSVSGEIRNPAICSA